MNISNINDTSGDKDDESLTYLNIIVFIEATTSVLLVLGNGFVIALIQRRKLLGRSTNIFVFSLATADFLNGVLSIPVHIMFLTFNWNDNAYTCKCHKFLIYITKTVVPYTIVLMTAEKTMRILCPTKEIVTVARCMFFTSLWWFFSAAFNIWCVVLYTTVTVPFVTSFGDDPSATESHYNMSLCILAPRFSYLHDVFLYLDVLVIFIIPLFIIGALYCVLVRQNFTVLRERILTYFYVIKLFVALFVNCFLCHLPQEIFTFLDSRKTSITMEHSLLSNAATSLYFTRGIWNLIIYAYFKHYVCRKKHFASIRASKVSRIGKGGLTTASLRHRCSRQTRERRV